MQRGSPGSNPFSSPWRPSWEGPHVGGPLRSGGKALLRLPALGAPGISAARLPADTVAWANFTPILFPLCEIPGRPSTLADIQNCHLSADINLEASVIPHIKMLSRGVSRARLSQLRGWLRPRRGDSRFTLDIRGQFDSDGHAT